MGRHAAPTTTLTDRAAEATERMLIRAESWFGAALAVGRRTLNTPAPGTVDAATRIADRFDADA